MKRFVVSLLFSSMVVAAQPEKNLISQMIVNKNRVEYRAHSQFHQQFLRYNLFVEYEKDINLEELDESIVVIPFIAQVASTIWASGQTYYIDSLDAEFYTSLKVIKKVLKKLYPRAAWNGEIIPKKIVNNQVFESPVNSQKLALTFSCGLDSTYSSLKERHIPQLLITLHGHCDTPLGYPEEWEKTKERMEQFARVHGHENCYLSTNYRSFLNNIYPCDIGVVPSSWRLDTIEGVGLSGVVAPMLIFRGYTKLHIAGSTSWDCPYMHAGTPFIDDNIRFAGVRVKHSGFEASRIQKLDYIINLCQKEYIPEPYLRVCDIKKDGSNCNYCGKCLRLINAFLCLGKSFSSFGFDMTQSEAEQQLKKHITSQDFSLFKIWHLQSMQSVASERNKRGMFLSNYLKWFMNFELKSSDLRSKINLNDFRDLYQNIPQKFLQ